MRSLVLLVGIGLVACGSEEQFAGFGGTSAKGENSADYTPMDVHQHIIDSTEQVDACSQHHEAPNEVYQRELFWGGFAWEDGWTVPKDPHASEKPALAAMGIDWNQVFATSENSRIEDLIKSYDEYAKLGDEDGSWYRLTKQTWDHAYVVAVYDKDDQKIGDVAMVERHFNFFRTPCDSPPEDMTF